MVLGHREVGHYFTQEKAAHWDGKNQLGEPVGNGVYLYRLQVSEAIPPGGTGDFQATRKMVVVK